MNFTSAVKKEIMQTPLLNASCKKAGLCAFILLCGTLICEDGKRGFTIVTETENVAEYYFNFLEECFGERPEIMNMHLSKLSKRDKLTFRCLSEKSGKIIDELGIEDRSCFSSLFNQEEEKLAFVKGMFLSAGSCTHPEADPDNKTGYHLEVVFPDVDLAESFTELLCSDFDIITKCVQRSEKFVVYIKSKEIISDFLNIVGAKRALKNMDELSLKRERNNNINRQNNCLLGNLEKTVQASIKQLQAIDVIESVIGLDSLEKTLFETATLRKAHPDLSVPELCEISGMTKSCFNHRMRKIMLIAKELGEA